jgi:glutamate synthase domain-containing protein 3
MSGGIAYVHDPLDVLARRCNLDTIELERLDLDDDEWLSSIVTRFAAETGSVLAARLASSWRDARSSFVAVVPLGWRDAMAPIEPTGHLVGAHA